MTKVYDSESLPPAKALTEVHAWKVYDFNIYYDDNGYVNLTAHKLILDETTAEAVANDGDVAYALRLSAQAPDNHEAISYLTHIADWSYEDLEGMDEWASLGMLESNGIMPPEIKNFLANLPSYVPEVEHDFVFIETDAVWLCRHCMIRFLPTRVS